MEEQNKEEKKWRRFNVKQKLIMSSALASLWVLFSIWLAQPWFNSLSADFGPVISFLIILGIAWLPGWATTFLIVSLLFDSRPTFPDLEKYPDITILVAAYNEEEHDLEAFKKMLK